MRGPTAMLRPVGRGVKRIGALPVEGYRAVVGWYRDRPRLATRVLASGAVVLAAVAVLFGVLHLQNVRTDSARTEARAVAEDAVPRLLSYDHRSIAQEVDGRGEQVGGRFREDYLSLLKNVVIPSSDRDQLVTQTSTAAVGTAEDSGSDQVRLMMFLNQTSTRSGQEQPTLSGSRVRVTMEHDGDRWLVSALDPV